MPHRYTLAPYKGPGSRMRCPQCRQARRFVPYLDRETGELLPPTVGRCDRQDKCGYHLTPKQYHSEQGAAIGGRVPKWDALPEKPPPASILPPSTMPVQTMQRSRQHFDRNNLAQFLVHTLGRERTDKALDAYLVGTAAHWPGATLFWQIDRQQRVRAGKIMRYDAATGKRVKDGPAFQWAHKLAGVTDYQLQQCFFGEHLLGANKQLPVAIVESEKTAIIASIYFPKMVWLATGGAQGLTPAKYQALKGRNCVLFPDAALAKAGNPTPYERWMKHAYEIQRFAHCTVSDLLERRATEQERLAGYDLADYLLQWKPDELALQSCRF